MKTIPALMLAFAKELVPHIISIKITDSPLGAEGSTGNYDSTTLIATRITRSNYYETLYDLEQDSFLMNLSVNLSIIDLVICCRGKGARYNAAKLYLEEIIDTYT